MKQFKFRILLLVCSILLTSVGFASTNVKEKACLDGVSMVDNAGVSIDNSIAFTKVFVLENTIYTNLNGIEDKMSVESKLIVHSNIDNVAIKDVKALGRQVKVRNILLHQLGNPNLNSNFAIAVNKEITTKQNLATNQLERGASKRLIFYV